MNPIIYACCLMEECIDHYEEGWRLEWSTDSPQLREVISMGGLVRWCVMKIIIYRPETAQAVDSVYLTYLHPVGLPVPPEDEWDNDLLLFDFGSNQSLCMEMVAIDKEELAVYALEGARAPKVGEQVESDIDPMDEDIIIYNPPKFWTMRQIVTYLPVLEMRLPPAEGVHHARAFVCWCEPTEAGSAS
jgi:hypothetical protein